MGEAGGPIKVTWRLQSAFLWRLDTVSLGKHQRNGVERQDKPSTTSQRIGAHAQGAKEKYPPPQLYGRAQICGQGVAVLLAVSDERELSHLVEDVQLRSGGSGG